MHSRRGAGVFVTARPTDYPLGRRVRFHQNVLAAGQTPVAPDHPAGDPARRRGRGRGAAAGRGRRRCMWSKGSRWPTGSRWRRSGRSFRPRGFRACWRRWRQTGSITGGAGRLRADGLHPRRDPADGASWPIRCWRWRFGCGRGRRSCGRSRSTSTRTGEPVEYRHHLVRGRTGDADRRRRDLSRQTVTPLPRRKPDHLHAQTCPPSA